MPSRGVVRYAVVGLGHIAQVAVLPAFAHAQNSRLVAVVSGDAAKRKAIGRKYRLEATYDYHGYEACLETVDAVYIALPNRMHAEYTIRAAAAGVHVLCEKPMAVTVDECERMIAACDEQRRQADDRLPAALRGRSTSRRSSSSATGRIGEPKFFSSSFSQTVRRGNIRTKREIGGGTLYDIGVYCINAARYLFRAEPTEVIGGVGQQRSGVPLGDRRVDGVDPALRQRPDRRVRHQLQRRRRGRRIASSARRGSCTSIPPTSTPAGSATR